MHRMKHKILLLLFLLWLPYFAVLFYKEGIREKNMAVETAFMKSERDVEKELENSLYHVIMEDSRGRCELGLEEYLTGILPSTIDMSYEPEVLKAQAILLRSLFLHEMDKAGVVMLRAEDFPYTYIPENDRQQLEANPGDAVCQKALEAVRQTEGIVMCEDGRIIPGTFCAISAGGTRCDASFRHPWLKSADCPESMEAEDYLHVYHFPSDTWREVKVLETDQRGYAVTVEADGEKMSGEAFRQQNGLASAWIRINRGEDYLIETHGNGHGMGMDQYYANCLIREGKKEDYRELLAYFFKDPAFEKITMYDCSANENF
ncbi:MAG: hypothetical protein E7294_11855 [Lachnospiraceae bacterium]|nr:hypothetical protein [Lachnospiraceae bacterium]